MGLGLDFENPIDNVVCPNFNFYLLIIYCKKVSQSTIRRKLEGLKGKYGLHH